MNWHRYPNLGRSGPIPGSMYRSTGDDGRTWAVYPVYEKGRGGRRLKKVVWRLYEDGRPLGRPFVSARLAKAFAEAYEALGDDRRARREFLRNGGEWSHQRQAEWRHERDEREYARYRAEGLISD
jgi:hypothetical protein